MTIKQVENYWNENLCGNAFVTAKYPSREFFEEYRKLRYKKTHHLNVYINWKDAKCKDVLEIGLGIGADATRWAKYAKAFTGIDLTDESVIATKKHFEILGLSGNIIEGNAEKLDFSDESFDIVYSHGVLHHTPDINASLKEAHRVLRKDGQFILMVYSKGSFNWWIRIQLYFRLRLILTILNSKALTLKNYTIRRSLTEHSETIWNKHLANFKRDGWSYLSWNNFPHHCTDGPDCEIANAYSRNEVARLLRSHGFEIKKIKKAHFPIGGKYPRLERFVAKYVGFHMLIWANKRNIF